MQENVKRLYYLGLFALLVALVIAFGPLNSGRASASSTWQGATTYWANVRTGPGTSYSIVTVDAPNTSVTVYATVSGQVIWGGISNWYRVSSFTSGPRYVYGGLIAATSSSSGGVGAPSPTAPGKEILVTPSRQWMWANQNAGLALTPPLF